MTKKSAAAGPRVYELDAEAGIVTLALDRGLYPLDVVYGAAYVLIDRAYVLLDRHADGRLFVRVSAKEPTSVAGLEALAGEMSNELLAQALRRKITQQNRGLLEAIVTQAIAGATGAMVPGAVDDEDDDLDFLDDPLGIAVPWEEKFSKEAQRQGKTATVEATTAGSAGPGDSGGHQPTSGRAPKGDKS